MPRIPPHLASAYCLLYAYLSRVFFLKKINHLNIIFFEKIAQCIEYTDNYDSLVQRVAIEFLKL